MVLDDDKGQCKFFYFEMFKELMKEKIKAYLIWLFKRWEFFWRRLGYSLIVFIIFSFIHSFTSQISFFQENGLEFEASVVAQCDSLINFIQHRKVELIEAITAEMNSKTQKIKEQIKACEEKGKKVAGVLQYAHECLQGTDAASFLLVRIFWEKLNWSLIYNDCVWEKLWKSLLECG